MTAFTADLVAIRQSARKKMKAGVVSRACAPDRGRVADVLNEVLATETLCTLRYRAHRAPARGGNAQGSHAPSRIDQITSRIMELGGHPRLDPEGMTARSHARYAAGGSIGARIREDLVAERIAVSTYSEIIRWLGDDDPTTRRMIEELRANEEEHASDMADLLGRMSW